jgi:GTPase SAR1 family protein
MQSQLTFWKFILIFICLLNLYSSQRNLLQNRFLVLFGPTRAGKSCFINTITGQKFANVGDDSGESTTKVSHIYKSKIDGFPENGHFTLIDTMGLDDTEDSEFSDPSVICNTTLIMRDYMKVKKIDLDAILVFESLTNDSNKLDNTLKKLFAVYGDNIAQSIIVILNKNPKPHPKRIEKIKAIIEKHKVKYLHWKTGCNPKYLTDIYYDQMSYLHSIIHSRRKKYYRNEINMNISKMIIEGKEILRTMEKIKLSSKLKKWVMLGTAGLMIFQMLNLPSFVLTNLVSFGMEELLTYLESNENFLVLLAVEERIKNKFTKKKEDL